MHSYVVIKLTSRLTTLTISFFIERQDDGKAVPGSKECAEVLPGEEGLRPVGRETADQ